MPPAWTSGRREVLGFPAGPSEQSFNIDPWVFLENVFLSRFRKSCFGTQLRLVENLDSCFKSVLEGFVAVDGLDHTVLHGFRAFILREQRGSVVGEGDLCSI